MKYDIEKWFFITIGFLISIFLFDYNIEIFRFYWFFWAVTFALGLGFLAGYIMSPMVNWIENNSSGLFQIALWILAGVMILVSYKGGLAIFTDVASSSSPNNFVITAPYGLGFIVGFFSNQIGAKIRVLKN